MVCSVRLNILVRYDTDLRVLKQLLVDKVKYYKEGEPITEDKIVIKNHQNICWNT